MEQHNYMWGAGTQTTQAEDPLLAPEKGKISLQPDHFGLWPGGIPPAPTL